MGKKTGITQLTETLHVDGSWREDIWTPEIATLVQGQISAKAKHMAVRELVRTTKHTVGRWIKLKTYGEIGQVRAVRSKDKNVNKKYIAASRSMETTRQDMDGESASMVEEK